MKNWKKITAALLTLVLVFSFASVAMAKTYVGSCGQNTTWELNGSGVLTIKGTGSMKAYAPNSKSDFRQYDTSIKAVVVKSGVSGVGAHAFRALPALLTVNLKDGGGAINQYAFADCPALSSVTIGTAVLTVGPYAFSNCPALTSIVLPESVSMVQNHAFADCAGLKTVEVQNKTCSFAANDIFPQGVIIKGYKGSTAQTYAEKNGLTFQTLDASGTEDPTQPATQPTQPTQPTADAGKCKLCGEVHEGFPGSLLGGLHAFIYAILIMLGMRNGN